MTDPIPFPDEETYARAVRGVLAAEEAREVLSMLPWQRESGCFAVSTDLNPITLGLVVVFPAFAEWYMRRYPEAVDTLMEIRSMSEERALEEIRRGRWVQHFTA